MTAEEFMAVMGEYFEDKGVESCWEWAKSKDRDGYGKLGLKLDSGRYRSMSAHRLSYLVTYGDPGPGIFVMHICNNPPCFNPGHLAAGTHKANQEHHKHSGGRTNSNKRLRPELIENLQEARVSGLSVREICDKYGVSASSVKKYTNGIATDK